MSRELTLLDRDRDREIARRVDRLATDARRWWRYPAYLGGVSAFGLGLNALLGIPASTTAWTLGVVALTFLLPLRRDLKLLQRTRQLAGTDDYFYFYRDYVQQQIKLLRRQRRGMVALSIYMVLAVMTITACVSPTLGSLLRALPMALLLATPTLIGARRGGLALAEQRANLEALAA